MQTGRLALGLLEVRGEAAGLLALDAAAKTAGVRVAFGRPVCPGKFLVFCAGGISDVWSAVSAGEAAQCGMQVRPVVLSVVHEDVWSALTGTTPAVKVGGLAVLETYSAASSLLVADSLAKAANIQLLRVRLASGLGGKGLVFCCGAAADLEEAVTTGRRVALGCLADARVLPSPHRRLWELVM